MEAKDTMMSDEQLGVFSLAGITLEQDNRRDLIIHVNLTNYLIAQDEISFKEGAKLSLEKQGLAYLEGKQSGIKEVVEYIKKYRSESTSEFICLTFLKETWSAKLKEWGIVESDMEL